MTQVELKGVRIGSSACSVGSLGGIGQVFGSHLLFVTLDIFKWRTLR